MLKRCRSDGRWAFEWDYVLVQKGATVKSLGDEGTDGSIMLGQWWIVPLGFNVLVIWVSLSLFPGLGRRTGVSGHHDSVWYMTLKANYPLGVREDALWQGNWNTSSQITRGADGAWPYKHLDTRTASVLIKALSVCILQSVCLRWISSSAKKSTTNWPGVWITASWCICMQTPRKTESNKINCRFVDLAWDWGFQLTFYVRSLLLTEKTTHRRPMVQVAQTPTPSAAVPGYVCCRWSDNYPISWRIFMKNRDYAQIDVCVFLCQTTYLMIAAISCSINTSFTPTAWVCFCHIVHSALRVHVITDPTTTKFTF